MSETNHHDGWLAWANICRSPNFDQREFIQEPTCLVIHCISLPPGEYGSGCVQEFFQNALDSDQHSYFESIAHLKVSAHCLIDRQGEVFQFVSFNDRAWHAGESFCQEHTKVNDFSIGIELEGLDTDESGFTAAQYQTLARLTCELMLKYPRITPKSIFAHSDIAIGRKPDPGEFFNWRTFLSLLDEVSI